MARLLTDEKPARPAGDSLAPVNAAISRLASIVEQMASRPPAQEVIPRVELPAPEPRPIRLEGEIKRDKAGRMTSIIITPVYW